MMTMMMWSVVLVVVVLPAAAAEGPCGAAVSSSFTKRIFRVGWRQDSIVYSHGNEDPTSLVASNSLEVLPGAAIAGKGSGFIPLQCKVE